MCPFMGQECTLQTTNVAEGGWCCCVGKFGCSYPDMVAEDYFGSILKSTKVATFVQSNPQMFKLLWILFFAYVHKDVVLDKKVPDGDGRPQAGE